MNKTLILCGIMSVLLCACGTEHKTVIVNPPPGSTVVVPPNGNAQVEPN